MLHITINMSQQYKLYAAEYLLNMTSIQSGPVESDLDKLK